MIRYALPMIACVALAACGKDAPPPPSGDDARSAEGQVLGGEISDAMIPLDTLTSSAPKMKDEPAAAGSGAAETGSDDVAADEDGEGAPAAAEEPAAADEPAAATEPAE